MSRSCHSATFSIAGVDVAAHHAREAGEVLASAPDCACAAWPRSPSGPGEKNSSASSTSVRCRWRISVASRSIDEAMTPSVAKNMAWRSRGITWVETGSGCRPSFSATWASTRGSILAKVPTAPEIAQVAISARAASSRRAGAVEFGIGSASLRPKVVGSAWMPWLRPIGRCHLCSSARRLQCGQQRVEVGDQEVGGAHELDAKQVSSTSDEVMP